MRLRDFQRMPSGVLSRIRYLTHLNGKRFESLSLSTQKGSGESSWKELADLSYGKKTMEHRVKLRKTFLDLRRVLEKNNANKLIEIGSYAVGASTCSSDLDLLLIPHASDRSEDRIEEFKKNMNNMMFRKQMLYPLAMKLNQAGVLKNPPDVIFKTKVPIIQGKTRTGVAFDIQMGSVETVYSTNYTRVAFQLDPRQILVYHWLRKQTEKYCLFGGRDALFTAFHLYMLVIHFAQATGILPNLMDEHPLHLSRACHWSDLTEDFREGKTTLDAIYSTEDADVWAPVLTDQLIDYYGSIDFTKVEIDVGRTSLKERMTNELLLIEPFHDQKLGVCSVRNGATFMNLLFSKLKNRSG